MTHKDAGQAGSGEQMPKRYDIYEHSYDVQFLRECVDGDYVKHADYESLSAENATLRAALESMSAIAGEAARLNDADHIKGNSIKAHKLLMALAGMIPGYRPDVDTARAALSPDRKGP